MGSGIQKNDLLYSITDVLLGEVPIETAIQKLRLDIKFWVQTVNFLVSSLPLQSKKVEFILKNALNETGTHSITLLLIARLA